jgi:hypothetical protein
MTERTYEGNGIGARESTSREPAFSLMERAPWYILYAFHIPYCAYLALRYGGFALPTISNPGLDASGLTKESKTELFSKLGPTGASHLPHFITIEAGIPLAEVARRLEQSRLFFPLVVKPNIGRRGFGVKVVASQEALGQHLARFSSAIRLVVQRYAPGPGEAGIFYVRMPSDSCGRIISMGVKHFPEVKGDGISTIEQLILRDPRARAFKGIYLKRNLGTLSHVLKPGESYRIVSLGNHVRGCICEDATALITSALEEKFDRIAKEIDGFFVGRFDVRYETIEQLRRGEGFEIVEYNGASGEPIHMWDRHTSIANTYSGLFGHLRYLYAIGAQNRARGFRPLSVWSIVRRHFDELSLLRSYPDKE